MVTDFVEAPMSEDVGTRAQARDEFRALFEAAYGPVVRTVWLVVRDRALAEEVAQDAFVELYRHWGSVRHYDRPDLWVRRVAIRRAQREAARTRRRTLLERIEGAYLSRPVSFSDMAATLRDSGLTRDVPALRRLLGSLDDARLRLTMRDGESRVRVPGTGVELAQLYTLGTFEIRMVTAGTPSWRYTFRTNLTAPISEDAGTR